MKRMCVNMGNSSYLPATGADVSVMLERIGLPSLEALFEGIPENVRLQTGMSLPGAMDEWRLTREMRKLAGMNLSCEDAPCFLGAGVYDHFVPSAVHHLVSRGEFWTAYTPYQAEMSQGMLQAIFEFQSTVTALTGMDGANASLYDGATALVEGALLAVRTGRRMRLLLSQGIHPEYLRVLRDTLRHMGIELVDIPVLPLSGRMDTDALSDALQNPADAVLVQNPNFFGVVEDLTKIAEVAHGSGALCQVSFDPVSLGLLQAPGRQGADICTGEGQPLGLPMSFGGPGLGLFAVKAPLIRQMPGRIVGQTRDMEGRRGFVLTLQAREQHIRRERAASNICTNQALCALAATVHAALLGPEGLRAVAQGCLDNAMYLCQQLEAQGLAERVFTSPFFREFAVYPVLPPEDMNRALAAEGIIGGLDLSDEMPWLRGKSRQGAWLLAATEKRTREEMDRFCQVLCEVPQIGEIRSQRLSGIGGEVR